MTRTGILLSIMKCTRSSKTKKNYFNNFIVCIYMLLTRSLENLQSKESQIRACQLHKHKANGPKAARSPQNTLSRFPVIQPLPLTSLRVLPGRRRISSLCVPGVDHLGTVLGHQLDQTCGKTQLFEHACVLCSLLKQQTRQRAMGDTREPPFIQGFRSGVAATPN